MENINVFYCFSSEKQKKKKKLSDFMVTICEEKVQGQDIHTFIHTPTEKLSNTDLHFEEVNQARQVKAMSLLDYNHTDSPGGDVINT